MDSIVLYTTGCPRCKILELKLNTAGIEYTTISDVDVMIQKGMMSSPNLEVDGIVMDFATANKWINERG